MQKSSAKRFLNESIQMQGMKGTIPVSDFGVEWINHSSRIKGILERPSGTASLIRILVLVRSGDRATTGVGLRRYSSSDPWLVG
jgi:hypothetical protein